MKFLVTTTRRQTAPMPPQAIAEILTAQRGWFDEHLADGTYDCAYAYAQGGGGVAIANAQTTEELNHILTGSPLWPIADFDVVPLTDVKIALENGARAIERSATIHA